MATTQRVARFHPENWKQSETGNYIRWLPSNPPLVLSFTCYRFYTSCTMGVFINVLQKILTISQCNPNAAWTARNTRHAAEQIVDRRNWECLEDMCNAQHGGKCLGELHGWTANNNTLSGGTLSIPRIYSYLCMLFQSEFLFDQLGLPQCGTSVQTERTQEHIQHHFHHDILYALALCKQRAATTIKLLCTC